MTSYPDFRRGSSRKVGPGLGGLMGGGLLINEKIFGCGSLINDCENPSVEEHCPSLHAFKCCSRLSMSVIVLFGFVLNLASLLIDDVRSMYVHAEVDLQETKKFSL